MIDNNTNNTVYKFKSVRSRYMRYLYKEVAQLDCEICELPAPENTPEERERFVTDIPSAGWQPVKSGQQWGGEFCYAWFRTSYTVPTENVGKKLLLLPDTQAPESLLFVNGKARGLFDVCRDGFGNVPRQHNVFPLTMDARPGDQFDILLEGYAGHKSPGNDPGDSYDYSPGAFYPHEQIRTYQGVRIVEPDMVVAEFAINHLLICHLLDSSNRDSFQYGQLINVIREVFALVPQFPWENGYDFHPQLIAATQAMEQITKNHADKKWLDGYVGLIGHSHLDTAWHWPVREALHKAARTFSNALTLMEHYPDYRFVQSSVLYIDWMKKHYPDIYEGIKMRTSQGRWEPNGGAWVEFDNNLSGGEFIIRQFLRGQRYTVENLGYMADCFWEPDTFGYSAALPQILKGCGIRYFLTTKLSWNEANQFPHDTFVWKGIDGTPVLTHFNVIHSGADPMSLVNAMKTVRNRDVTDMKLLSYGYGDGGGGPSFTMQEYAQRTKEVPWVPRAESTTVSDFMHRLEKTAKDLPVFTGELYLELHRGTLTQIHDIKRSNRMLEKAIRHMEFANILYGQEDSTVLKDAIDTLLLNQFHDILPGTCIEDAHKVAVFQNYRAEKQLRDAARSLAENKPGESMVLMNTLSWCRSGQIIVDDNGFVPADCVVQRYEGINGSKKMAFSGVTLLPMTQKSIQKGKALVAEIPFAVNGDEITTPFARITMRDGEITSYICRDGFEVVRDPERPLNTLYCGEDIPAVWDNWNLDYDQKVKMKPIKATVSQKVVSIGALQLRIRVKKRFGEGSTITQDIVFYSDSPRIDFETIVDWQEVHTLLKAGFDVNVLAKTARFETQFGYLERVTHENYGVDKSQFEVCNHKWTDLSDSRFGVALLNDCKYGISVKNSDMRLTLHKGGCHPDGRGDKGVHEFTYSILVHESGFSTASVIRPAYELNYPVTAYFGCEAVSEDALIQLDSDNIIVEAVKNAEDKDGIVVRLYETEGTHTFAELRTSIPVVRIEETDMLEYRKADISVSGGAVKLEFRPFEIKTLKLCKK